MECDGAYDLLTIMDGDLNLKCYIKGPKWNEKRDKLYHYRYADFYKNYILALYDGTLWADVNLPRICHVFDIEGNYIKTLDFDSNIITISVDEENDRLYITLDDEIQFGYMDLNEILS